MKNGLINFFKDNKSFIVFMILMFVFRSAVADWNTVPTGSMKPTIVEGDRILVDKMAYDLRVPFTHISLIKRADPVRGDIIIFDSKAADKRLVKRVIGVPGDIVALSNNILTINGQRLKYAFEENSVLPEINSMNDQSMDLQENLLGVDHRIRVNLKGSTLSNFPPVRVPANQYLTMGDNRDNSADSRVIGFIPRNEIVGKTNSVVLSFNYDNYYIPRSNRFFKPLI